MKAIRQRTRKLAWALTLAVAAWLLPASMALAGHGHGGGHVGGGGGGHSTIPGHHHHHGYYGGAWGGYYPWGYDWYYGGYNGIVNPNVNNAYFNPWGFPASNGVLDDLRDMGVPF